MYIFLDLLDNSKIKPQILEAVMGDDITFKCDSLVPPKWIFKYLYDPINMEIVKGNTVVIKNFRPGNRGYVTCLGWDLGDDNVYQFKAKASLKALCKLMATATLKVLCIYIYSKTKPVPANASIEISC